MKDLYFIEAFSYANKFWQRYDTFHLFRYGKQRLISSLKLRGYFYNRSLRSWVCSSDNIPQFIVTIKKVSYEK